jgi:hypothetical protein
LEGLFSAAVIVQSQTPLPPARLETALKLHEELERHK